MHLLIKRNQFSLSKSNVSRRAIGKVTSGELLKKQVMRKKLFQKNTYILKLLLNVTTAGIETPVV
jgi:hypothetical protein